MLIKKYVEELKNKEVRTSEEEARLVELNSIIEKIKTIDKNVLLEICNDLEDSINKVAKALKNNMPINDNDFYLDHKLLYYFSEMKKILFNEDEEDLEKKIMYMALNLDHETFDVEYCELLISKIE